MLDYLLFAPLQRSWKHKSTPFLIESSAQVSPPSFRVGQYATAGNAYFRCSLLFVAVGAEEALVQKGETSQWAGDRRVRVLGDAVRGLADRIATLESAVMAEQEASMKALEAILAHVAPRRAPEEG